MTATKLNTSEEILNASLSTKLDEIMTTRQIGQRELARRAQLGQSQVSKLLSGEVHWTLHTLIRICQALKVSPDYMLRWRVKENPL